MAKPPESQPEYSLSRVICRNRKARHEYELLHQLECGLILRGSEVKSVRNNKISIEEAYVRVENAEVWLIGCDIAEYPQATYLNHDPKRQRKLLMHKREREKFAASAQQKGLTLIPLDVHLTRGLGRFPDHERWLTGSEMRLLTSNRVCEPLRQIVLPVPEERRLFGSA